jgi:SpoVK/Ycf46/Vps4 family AAA+-type ATPase
MVSDEESHEEKPPASTADDQGAQYDMSGGFHQVLGCEQAKSALFENIILPLQCTTTHQSTVFQGDILAFSPTISPFSDSESPFVSFAGIRAGSGNVLLHGPPGTGKTLLAQVLYLFSV